MTNLNRSLCPFWQALEDEGHEPTEYVFEISKGTPAKKPGGKDTSDKENESDAAVEVKDGDTVVEEAKCVGLKIVVEKIKPAEEEPAAKAEEAVEDKPEEKVEDKPAEVTKPVEAAATPAPAAPAAVATTPAVTDAPAAAAAAPAAKSETADNEDSLNLEIGEEEEKLFNDEVTTEKPQVPGEFRLK